jgi:hypothetical protein
MPVLFNLMHQIGIPFNEGSFLTNIVKVAAMSSLRDMKYRVRIPLKKGYVLYSIMDETNELKEGEVYIATDSRDESGKRRRHTLIESRVVVTRAPALHPGDIQITKAVEVSKSSPLNDLSNCIVFSQQGSRDLPTKLGGGDLDGDMFHVIYDERLIPPLTYQPSKYTPAEAQNLGRSVQVDDIADFFVEYMQSDRLAQISVKHKIRADQHDDPAGTLNPDCVNLANLASDAVDFSKSGKPVDMTRVGKGPDHIRPDFMANGPTLVMSKEGALELKEAEIGDIDDPDAINVLDPDSYSFRYYKTDKILGVLHRKIDQDNFFSRMTASLRPKWGDESLVEKLERYIDRETSYYQWEQ